MHFFLKTNYYGGVKVQRSGSKFQLLSSIGFPAHFRQLVIQFKKMCFQFRPGHSGMCECSFQFHLWSISFETLSFNFVHCHPFSSIAIQIRRSQELSTRQQNQFRLLAFIFVKVSLKFVSQIYGMKV